MDISQLISSLKVPKLFREIITLIGGIGFLLILWVLKLQHINFNLGVAIARPEIDLLFLIFAYLIGKIILSFTSILDWFDLFINHSLSEKKEVSSLDFWHKVKKFLLYRSVGPAYFDKIKNTITIGEVYGELAKYELFEESFERDRQALLFSQFFIIYSILFIVYFNSFKILSIILTIFFIMRWYKIKRELFSQWIDFQAHMVKERNMEF